MRLNIRLSGTGGQGLILAGIILAEAAGVHERKHVLQTQSYGPEARGGFSRADVIISTEEIFHTEVEKPDFLLCLSQEAYARYAGQIVPDGLLIIDPMFVKTDNSNKITVVTVETTKIAADLGTIKVANIVALGVMAAATAAVSPSSLELALLKRVPRGTEEINKKALAAGYQAMAGC